MTKINLCGRNSRRKFKKEARVMNKFKYFQDIISDLRGLADNLQALVDSADGTSEPEPESTQKPEPLKPTITLEQIRAALADKSQSGKTEEAHALIIQFGAEKLSAIDPDKYPELLEAVRKL
jgi:hypothetical protein